jgi:excinuclease ABC subunit A
VALATKILEKNIMEISSLQIDQCYNFISSIKFKGEKKIIANTILKEILNRLQFLLNVGLEYLTLNRSAKGLSGGEFQRIRLSTQIGSALSGVLYVLDEPSIGLHQKDNELLIKTLKSLKDLGNTVLVVEHDLDTMKKADYIIDLGPGAGVHGGEVVAYGTLDEIKKNKNSLTAQYLTHKKVISLPLKRKKLNTVIQLQGATLNNIQNLDVNFPLGGLVCITGVSGSGKSTLVHKILVPGIKYLLEKKLTEITNFSSFKSLKGIEKIRSFIELDQSPIGKSPNSNPATYTGLFNDIRELFSQTPDSKMRGYKAGRFSFNIRGGRCEECEGNGLKKIEMHFLPDVYITCSECHGKRFNNETLSILYKGKNIADILELTIEEAESFFKNHPRLKRILSTLNGIGLGYMALGQPATTMSGGEAQRLKLSKELSKQTKGPCLYILDEPTTGLHIHDIEILLHAIFQLIDEGHSILIIEHNLDIIKMADHIIDLGPGGGDKGGKIIAEGSPEVVSKNKASSTGKYLKPLLKK